MLKEYLFKLKYCLRLSFCIKSGMRHSLVLTILLSAAVSCDGLKMPKNIFESSERAKYERNFSGADSIMIKWKANYISASGNHLKITDGYTASVFSAPSDAKALGYSVELKKGDLLKVVINSTETDRKIFADILPPNGNIENSESELLNNNTFSKVIENDGWHRVVIQPEIDYQRSFELQIYTQPSIAFPVEGKGNRDIQSFWGAGRDGGSRSHEGVDIFASRGTPVISVSKGFITRTGNQGLGGKQVWLRDGDSGNSYYYAHLDSVMIEAGKNVRIGDTLGLVGNTGNAAGGAAHLHFGIYAAGGAVDPYPYIRMRTAPALTEAEQKIKPSGKYLKTGTNLRAGAGIQFEIVSTVNSKTGVMIIASHGKWYHGKTADGIEGFFISDRLE